MFIFSLPTKQLTGSVKLLFCAFCFLFLTGNIANAQALRTDGKKIVDDKGNNVILRGFGLGGWMLQEGYMLKVNKDAQQNKIRQRIEELIGPKQTEEFYNAWLANHTRKVDVDSLKAWGFNSIRLPMHFNLYTLPVDKEPVAGQNTWLEKGFRITDSLLAWCKANKMYLILDLHAAPGGQGNDLNIADRDPAKPSLWDSPENQQKTIALWKKLADRYKNEPWIGGYDIINEPNWGFEDPADKNGTKEKKNEPLKKLLVEITKAIRQVDQKHIVIIEGNGWGNNYSGIVPDWDKNMVMSFHKYWNYNDESSIGHIIKARDNYNIPVWLGETGENSNVWFTDAISLLERNNIGWAWWPLKKIGFNNPMEIKSNANYDAVVNYFNGSGSKPTAGNAYAGLMQLAKDTRLENTIIHHDVIDAMIRQPHNNTAKPFKANKVGNKTRIYAVDFDLGRNSTAYFDTDTADYHVSTNKRSSGNTGRVYRNDGVDINVDSTQQYYVTKIEKGEWLQYTVKTDKKATYNLKLATAANADNGKITVLLDGKAMTSALTVPNNGHLKDFKSFDAGKITLSPGSHTIRIIADEGGFNFSYFEFLN